MTSGLFSLTALCFAQVPDPSETEVASGEDNATSITSEPAATVTPSPTPAPIGPPDKATITPVLKDDKGAVCISVNASIGFRVSYVNNDSQDVCTFNWEGSVQCVIDPCSVCRRFLCSPLKIIL